MPAVDGGSVIKYEFTSVFKPQHSKSILGSYDRGILDDPAKFPWALEAFVLKILWVKQQVGIADLIRNDR